jgi:phytoene/squalene synthetase
MTARLLVDRDLVDDCCRAYGYFRWADDVVDAPTSADESSRTKEERIAFIRRQRGLIDSLYRSERPSDLAPEEEIIADLISHDRGESSGLKSFILNFLAIIEFDAERRGRLVSEHELAWYSDHLGKAVTDAIQYFVGNGHPYPAADNRYLAATAAHITHMLRDIAEDTAEGYVNIPHEYLDAHAISPEDVGSPLFRAWVRQRVKLARQFLRDGKQYIDLLDVLRCKIAAYWYCARFEGVLDTIERDDYHLRDRYNERDRFSTWLRMAWLGVAVTIRHVAHLGRRSPQQLGLEGKDHEAVGETS